MFEDLKRAWREAVANFHHEMSDGDDATAGAHARALRREIATARGVLAQLDAEIRKTARGAEEESTAAADCRRREQLARQVGDAETVRVAVEFAARHDERAAVLQRKLVVLTDERALLVRDLERMESLAPAAAAAAAITDDPPARDSARAKEDAEFRRMQRERTAAERLEELKRRMR
jgi:hypothetical protein